jgi:hypothetical protein
MLEIPVGDPINQVIKTSLRDSCRESEMAPVVDLLLAFTRAKRGSTLLFRLRTFLRSHLSFGWSRPNVRPCLRAVFPQGVSSIRQSEDRTTTLPVTRP